MAKRITAVVLIQKLVRHVCNTTSNITAAPTATVIVIAIATAVARAMPMASSCSNQSALAQEAEAKTGAYVEIPKMAPRWLKICPRLPQDGAELLQALE